MVGDLLKTRRKGGEEGEKEGGRKTHRDRRTRTENRHTDQSFYVT